MSSAPAQYKKKDGTLAASQDKQSVHWTPAGASAPTLIIQVKEITNLQQTPEKAAKVSLRIVVQRDPTSAAENHTFTFTSPTARADQVAITQILRDEIEALKQRGGASHASGTPAKTATPAPSSKHEGQPAALAIAHAVTAAANSDDDKKYEASRLLSDIPLQRSLLESNPQLQQRLNQALREKPESISMSQFSQQFWESRVHLLRAHAVEMSQNQGQYNVLSRIKPKHDENGALELKLSLEQVQLILNQHPLVRTVYDKEVFSERRDERGLVTKGMSEPEFWSKFFTSRLFKKLKGETITEMDPTEPRIDKYLNFDEEAERSRQLNLVTVPHFIDLEGNEQNHSQRKGNAPDITMRSRSRAEVPILRVLNSMSEKMMADVTPSDLDPHAPAGMVEETYRQLQLRDLQREGEDNRITLQIKDQKRFFSRAKGDQLSAEASFYAKQSPTEVMSKLKGDFEPLWSLSSNTGGLDLQVAIGYKEDSDDDEDTNAPKKMRIGSKAARSASTRQIMSAIQQRRTQSSDLSSLVEEKMSSTGNRKYGFPSDIYDSLTMTHNTTVEFLHYFWSVFLSGDPDRAGEIAKLVETLDRSLDRIKAVADAAEEDRNRQIERAKKQLQEHYQRTGRKKAFNPAVIKAGGAASVNALMAPTVRAIKAATDEYRRVLEAQMSQNQPQPGQVG